MFSIEASHFDAGTAYAAIDAHRAGDYTPYFFRTRDYGKTWTRIVNGLPVNEPSGSFARVIRADTEKRGLLFAGTESAMYVSFDDGDYWQSLMLNLPNDVVSATSRSRTTISSSARTGAASGCSTTTRCCGSSRRRSRASPRISSSPGDAVRVRRNVGADTPFPPEVPHALNPPDGAIIDYWLAQAPSGDITLDVLDAAGRVVRHLSSAAEPPVPEAARPPHPNFWVAPPSAAEERRRKSDELGSALRRAAGVLAQLRDQRESGAHAGVAGGSAGDSGHPTQPGPAGPPGPGERKRKKRYPPTRAAPPRAARCGWNDLQ